MSNVCNFLGSGYYILFDSSKMFLYDEKATLLSPWIKKRKSMSFHYYMYGQRVETLDVTVQTKNKEMKKTVWSRHGNQGNQWKEGCVLLEYDENFKVWLV